MKEKEYIFLNIKWNFTGQWWLKIRSYGTDIAYLMMNDYGSPGRRHLYRWSWNDTIDGGEGTDIAIFSGNKSDYTITETGYAQYQVVDNQGSDGTDTLRDVETLRFSDQNFDITPSGQNLQGTSSEIL